MDEIKFGVPAGWYPDPLGLPQLRWWDALAWTEHTSEARAPIVIQPMNRPDSVDEDEDEVRLHQDDEDLPSRREQRERERHENGADRTSTITEDDDQDELSAQPLLTMTLRELQPPETDTVDDFTPGPKRASAHANAMPAASLFSTLAEDEAPQRAPKRMKTYTVAAWLIAAMPVLQLTTMLLLLLVFRLGSNVQLMTTVVLFPYLLVLGLAFYDRLELQTWGHKHPAGPAWALLTEPAYLVVRAIRTFRETGKGFAPAVFWFGSLGAIFAAILILPGLLISVLPGAFASEAERSVTADAAVLGATIKVTCPAPALFVGELFTCRRESPNGTTDSVAVSLQRQNGWVAWRVEDWGTTVMPTGR